VVVQRLYNYEDITDNIVFFSATCSGSARIGY